MALPIKISSLRTFVAVAEHGNIALAAEQMGRTPAAVSLTLKQLEEVLGQPLFHGDRKSTLSPLGEFALDQARRQIQHFDYTLRNLERFARNEIGQLTIACVPSVANRVLPAVINTFHRQWPNVELELYEMDSVGVRDALQRREVEIGIVSDNVNSDKGTFLMHDHFGVVCHHEHPLTRKRTPIRWADLADTSIIANRLCHIIDSAEFHDLLNEAKLRVHNTGSLLALAAADVGITILPSMAVPDDASDITFLPLHERHHKREIHMLAHDDAPPSPVVKAWQKLLVDSVKLLPHSPAEIPADQ